MIIGDGKNTKFWKDIWLDELPLKIVFSGLFEICSNQDVLVSDVITTNFSTLCFKRQLSIVHRQQLTSLHQKVFEGCSLTNKKDVVKWQGKDLAKIRNKFFYQWITDNGVKNNDFQLLWELPIPLKIQLFCWLFVLRKILVRTNLVKKGWVGPTTCIYCQFEENVDHLFFRCSQVQGVWVLLCQTFDWLQKPSKVEDLAVMVHQSPTEVRKFRCLVCIAYIWVQWLARNASCFQDSKPLTTNAYYYKIKHLLAYWSLGWKETLKMQLANWLELMKEGINQSELEHLTEIGDEEMTDLMIEEDPSVQQGLEMWGGAFWSTAEAF